MTSKLRRPPLFSVDGSLGFRSLYISDRRKTSSTPSQRSGLSMDCGSLATSKSPSNSPSVYPSSSTAKSMTSKRSSGGGRVGLHVNFDTEKDEIQERKKKYLTAKYGQHQMSLIKKRLSVEMWMFERLQFLYGCDDVQIYNDLDLDELLDIDGDYNKKNWLMSKLTETKQSQDVVNKFVDELLEKSKIL